MEGSVTSGLNFRQCPKYYRRHKDFRGVGNVYTKGGQQSEKIQWYSRMLGQGSAQRMHIGPVNNSAPLEQQFKSSSVFKEIQDKLKQEGSVYVKKLKAVYCFKLTDGPQGKEGVWYVDAKNGKGSVEFGEKDVKPDCTFKMKDEDCFNLMTGKMNPQTAFMRGKLKISGNIGLAMKLKELQPSSLKSKL